MNVNYVTENRLFVENAVEWGLSATDCMVWHALFHIFNARHWPDGYVTIDNNRVLLYAPISINALQAARGHLVERGLLLYIKGSRKTSAPMYQLVLPSTIVGADAAEDCASDCIGNCTQDCTTQSCNSGYLRLNINKDINQNTNIVVSPSCAPAREDDDVNKAFGKHFGIVLTADERGSIRAVMQEHNLGTEVLDAAVCAAREHGAQKPVQYVLSVLRDWAANGVRATEAARYGSAPKKPRMVIEQCYEQREYEPFRGIDPWMQKYLDEMGITPEVTCDEPAL